MKQYAKHKVTVELYSEMVAEGESTNGSKWALLVPTGKMLPDWEIEHPEECDKLKYGQKCCLDFLLEYDSEGMPEEAGVYEVWAVDDSSFVNNWSHYGWESEYYIQFSKISESVV